MEDWATIYWSCFKGIIIPAISFHFISYVYGMAWHEHDMDMEEGFGPFTKPLLLCTYIKICMVTLYLDYTSCMLSNTSPSNGLEDNSARMVYQC